LDCLALLAQNFAPFAKICRLSMTILRRNLPCCGVRFGFFGLRLALSAAEGRLDAALPLT